ncbi:AAA-domain-containing protein [Acephala macrosclerotiorum]|nr:AAA-domain-containing protein [Acephala macrosclerotiorum]
MGENNVESLERGMIFVEGQLKDRSQYRLEPMRQEEKQLLMSALKKALSSANNVFEIGQDVLGDTRNAMLMLGEHYDEAKAQLSYLKVVEYQGQLRDGPIPVTCYSAEEVDVDIKLYTLYTDGPFNNDKEIPQAQITRLPNRNLQDTWSRLIFGSDIKDDLIWMMQNLIRHQACIPDLSRLVLLHGPPGTGKTSLSQGLAQKISIRLSSTYERTHLVDEIFNNVASMCEDDPKGFTCVLIDEVESIAGSREFSTLHGESQDSLRATNTRLTGLDRMQKYPNVIFLCTANLFDALDSAFLDRCGLKCAIDPPSEKSQYEILRQCIQKMIDNKINKSNDTLLSYDNAILDSYNNPAGAANSLMLLVKQIRTLNSGCQSGREIVGRTLIQLPMQAVMRYNRSEKCSLDIAFKYIERLLGESTAKIKKKETGLEQEHRAEEGVLSSGKRKLSIGLESSDGFDENIQNHVYGALASLKGKRIKLSVKVEIDD